MIKSKKFLHRHIRIKQLKPKDEEKVLKAARENNILHIGRNNPNDCEFTNQGDEKGKELSA